MHVGSLNSIHLTGNTGDRGSRSVANSTDERFMRARLSGKKGSSFLGNLGSTTTGSEYRLDFCFVFGLPSSFSVCSDCQNGRIHKGEKHTA